MRPILLLPSRFPLLLLVAAVSFHEEYPIYTLGGAAFGLCFPVVATLLSAYMAGGTLAPSALLEAQAGDPLLWIIDSAPLWLSLLASVAGRRQDRADQLNHQLEIQLEQRRRVEKLLDRTSREQQAITDVIPDVLYVVDVQGKLFKWNRRLEGITGLTPDELYQREVLSLFLEKERPAIADVFHRIMSGEEIGVDAQFITREGPVLYQWNGIPILDEEGEVIGVAGTGRDVSEQHRMREALERSERDYRGLFEHAHDAIVVLDACSHAVLAVNEQACALYGFTQDEFATQAKHLFARQENEAEYAAATLSYAQGVRRFKTVQRRKDGTSVHVEANVAEVEYQGRPALLCISRDITQRMVKA